MNRFASANSCRQIPTLSHLEIQRSAASIMTRTRGRMTSAPCHGPDPANRRHPRALIPRCERSLIDDSEMNFAMTIVASLSAIRARSCSAGRSAGNSGRGFGHSAAVGPGDGAENRRTDASDSRLLHSRRGVHGRTRRPPSVQPGSDAAHDYRAGTAKRRTIRSGDVTVSRELQDTKLLGQ